MVVLSLLRRENRDTTAMFVNYGQAAVAEEVKASRLVADHFKTELISLKIEMPSSYGPGEIRYRNGALIFTAAMATAGHANCIALGIHAGVPYRDCSESFLASMEAVLKASHLSRLELIAPIKTWNKAEVISYAKQENLPLELTYSCEAGGNPPCGKCASCLDRIGL
jgi:7-cyano-7-deazaguanine synthase